MDGFQVISRWRLGHSDTRESLSRTSFRCIHWGSIGVVSITLVVVALSYRLSDGIKEKHSLLRAMLLIHSPVFLSILEIHRSIFVSPVLSKPKSRK
ncbi:uncharacterized protein HD556DRAFT_1261211, partial [Suillus plorans]